MNHSLEKGPFNNLANSSTENLNNKSSVKDLKYVPKPCFLNMRKNNQIVNAKEVDAKKFKSTHNRGKESIFVGESRNEGVGSKMSKNLSDRKFKSAFNQNINLNNVTSIDNYADTKIGTLGTA